MKRPAVWLSLVVLSLAFGGAARAEVPTRVDRGLLLRSGDGESFAAPIVGTAVAVRVTGIVARARVTQIFLNPTTAWVEGIYVFPLPEGAVVDALRMTIGDRVLSGVVREKRQAAAVYQQAKALGHRASLVELARPGVFTTSVANLGPGEKVEITVELQQVVEYGRGRFGLRFPMVVPPRYASKAEDVLPIPAPVAGPNAPSFSFHVELAPGFPVGSIDSSSHRVTVKRDDRERRYAVDLADGVAVADADFLLDWTPAVGRAPRAVHFTETVNGERYSLLMVMPPDVPEAAAGAPAARDHLRHRHLGIDVGPVARAGPRGAGPRPRPPGAERRLQRRALRLHRRSALPRQPAGDPGPRGTGEGLGARARDSRRHRDAGGVGAGAAGDHDRRQARLRAPGDLRHRRPGLQRGRGAALRRAAARRQPSLPGRHRLGPQRRLPPASRRGGPGHAHRDRQPGAGESGHGGALRPHRDAAAQRPRRAVAGCGGRGLAAAHPRPLPGRAAGGERSPARQPDR